MHTSTLPTDLYSGGVGTSLDKFIKARQEYGFGDRHDYFDHANTIGWTRLGDSEHPGAMAVVLTNGDGNKWMNMFRATCSFLRFHRTYPRNCLY